MMLAGLRSIRIAEEKQEVEVMIDRDSLLGPLRGHKAGKASISSAMRVQEESQQAKDMNAEQAKPTRTQHNVLKLTSSSQHQSSHGGIACASSFQPRIGTPPSDIEHTRLQVIMNLQRSLLRINDCLLLRLDLCWCQTSLAASGAAVIVAIEPVSKELAGALGCSISIVGRWAEADGHGGAAIQVA